MNKATSAGELGSMEQMGLASSSASAYEAGAEAALAGLPCPAEPPEAVQGWQHGNAKRRIQAGEVIGVVCQGTQCDACGMQTWGWRASCRCNGRVRHGVLVDDGLPDGASPKFMTVGALKALGKPVIDSLTGGDVALLA